MGNAVGLGTANGIAAIQLHVLAALGVGTLGLDLEAALGVLQENEGVEGCKPLIVLLARRSIVAILRTDGKHARAHAAQETAVFVGNAGIDFRDGMALVLVRAFIRTVGTILELLQDTGGQGHFLIKGGIEHELGTAVERRERGARLQVDHVRHISGQRMPALTDTQAQVCIAVLPQFVPEKVHIGLTHTKGTGIAIAVQTIEVGFNFTIDLGRAHLVAQDIQAQTGGNRLIVKTRNGIYIVAIHHFLVQRNKEEDIFCQRLGSPGVEESIIADKTVGFEMIGFILGRGQHKGAGGCKKEYNFFHILMQKGKSW